MEMIWARYGQKLFGKDLKVAVSMYAKNENCQGAHPVQLAPPTVQKDLVYRRVGPSPETQFYYPSTGEADMLCSENGEIRFVSAFEGDIRPYKFSLSLYAQPVGSNGFGIIVGRNGTYVNREGEHNEEARRFSNAAPRDAYMHFTLKDGNVREFKPVYVKARNRFSDENGQPEIINFVIEAEVAKAAIVIRARRVSEDELPACFKGVGL